MPVNPYEAPTGYVAIGADSETNCGNCAFAGFSARECSAYECMSFERKDGRSVIFIALNTVTGTDESNSANQQRETTPTTDQPPSAAPTMVEPR